MAGLVELVELLVPAALVLCVVRLVLVVRPPGGGAALPHPSKIPGLPMAGPATPAAIAAAINRGRSRPRPWWKFW
jgi:hypothetical protein